MLREISWGPLAEKDAIKGAVVLTLFDLYMTALGALLFKKKYILITVNITSKVNE